MNRINTVRELIGNLFANYDLDTPVRVRNEFDLQPVNLSLEDSTDTENLGQEILVLNADEG